MYDSNSFLILNRNLIFVFKTLTFYFINLINYIIQTQYKNNNNIIFYFIIKVPFANIIVPIGCI